MTQGEGGLSGRLLNGRYELLERLGVGGMAVVYRALDTRLGRTVSVKVLREQYAGDAEFLERFRREAQAVASLSHPNIVSIYDVGQDGETHFLVMEYVEGESLKKRLERQGPLPPAEAVDIALQILEALEHAHLKRVIHRDIKPHNILLTGDGQVKVTDFGVARAGVQGTLIHTGAIVGSAHYLSPEQARGRPVDARSDLYSLGVLLFEMLTGRVPFQGDDPLAVALKHIQEEPPPVRALNPAVPAALERVVARALAKDPSQRYQSVAEFRADLRAWQRSGATAPIPGPGPGSRAPQVPDGPAAGAPPDTMVVRGRLLDEALGSADPPAPQPRRSPARTAAVGLAVLLVLAAAVGYAYYAFLRWFEVPTVRVPDVVGLSLSEAQDRLETAGLGWEVVAERFDRQVPANHVIEQRIAAGEEVKRGRRVGLVISRGPELVQVPVVTGRHRLEARTLLENLGFAVEETQQHDEAVPADYVIEQNPRGGTLAEQGTTVFLRVSQGPPPPPFNMPNLIGSTRDDALRLLAEAGLRPGVVRTAPAGFPAGVVAAQEPVPGTVVRVGEAVDLVVSSGCIATARRVVPVPGPGAHQVRALLVDRLGERVIYEATHGPEEQAAFDVCWDGTAARLLIFLDGELFSQEVLAP